MKKMISIAMSSILITLFLVGSFALYHNAKQIIAANAMYDNVITLLQSCNFSSPMIDMIENNAQYDFQITKTNDSVYHVVMKYELQVMNDTKDKKIASDIYVAR